MSDSLARRAESIQRREPPRSTEDERLRRGVIRNLRRHAVAESPPDLRIEVSSGVVRLEGSVTLPAEKAMLGEIALFTEGVAAVENALRIRPERARQGGSR